MTTRRDFIKRAGFGAGAALAAATGRLESWNNGSIKRAGNEATSKRASENAAGREAVARIPFTLGLASYTFRAFDIDQTIALTLRLGLKAIALKSFHLPLEAPLDAVKAAGDKVRAAGLDLYGCGVVYMKSEAEIRQAFEYAKAAGMGLIIGVPEHELLPRVEKAVQAYGVKLALHNHGPSDKVYPTPESAYARIRGLDPRIGLCLDTGHATRSGLDAGAEIEKYFDRVLDVHIKDVTSADVRGGPIEIGRGVMDIPKILRALVRLGYAAKVGLEYEKDEKDPLPGAAESIGYVRGVLASL
ncbi:MAG: sugar phosphate isomerase/epimerase [Candidatus Aminicenantes bacterium]|nr:sugar phosphate isomerase/epimerase [Candidatus Aminicenantes bacterium]